MLRTFTQVFELHKQGFLNSGDAPKVVIRKVHCTNLLKPRHHVTLRDQEHVFNLSYHTNAQTFYFPDGNQVDIADKKGSGLTDSQIHVRGLSPVLLGVP